MQTVRNRWAHANTEGFPVDDVYRDLDTLQRFAGVIGADDELIQTVRATKAALLTDDNQQHPGSSAEPPLTPPTGKNGEAEFTPGQIVFVRSSPASCGAVTEVLPGTPENRVNVFMDGSIQTFYASQLQVQTDVPQQKPCPAPNSTPILPPCRSSIRGSPPSTR